MPSRPHSMPVKMKRSRTDMFEVVKLLTLAAAVSFGATGGAKAQSKITLRLADSLPANHIFTAAVAQPWMEEVTKQTNGKVTFEHYPAEQLGKAKDMLSMTQTGVADVAFVVPIYISDKLPLSGVVDLPSGFARSCDGMEAYWSLATGDGVLAKKEFGPNGIRILTAVVQPPFQVFTTHKSISSVKDLEGLKLRTAGGAQDLTATTLGAVSIKLTAPDTSEALRRGTIDGGILAHVSIGAYGLTDVVKFGTEGENFGSAALNWAISEAKWKTLPTDVQKIMADAGKKITMEACHKIDQDVADSVADWRKGGMKIVELPAPEHAALRKIFDDVSAKWAKGLDDRGRAGSQTLGAFRKALESKS
jgi:TRAP-type C4-dicarboxylate transport system substrate-binding protein